MNKKILNEINRQRQIMGLPTILLKEDTGISSIGEYFANVVKKIAKQSELTDEAGKVLMKIGKKTLYQEEFTKLLDDLNNGRYGQISGEILDEMALLIKTLKDEEGVSYFQKTMDEFTTQMRKDDPNFNFDEWAKVAEDRVNRNLETLDDSITRITGNNPLLKRIFEEDLIARYNKQVDLSAAENARRAAELAQTQQTELARLMGREEGDIINRIRNRIPGPASSFTDLEWYRYLITWKYSPLTKSQRWYDIPRLFETALLLRKDSNSELNIVLDEWEGICKAFFDRMNTQTNIEDIMSELGQELTSTITRLDALTPHDRNFNGIVEELVGIYRRNPELEALPLETQQRFIASFQEMIEHCNPQHPDFPAFFPAIFDLMRTSGLKWAKNFDEEVLEKMGTGVKKQKSANVIVEATKSSLRAIGICLEIMESHFFTGTVKKIDDWKKMMEGRPYLKNLYKKRGFPVLKFNRYVVWWTYTKLVIAPLFGVIIGTLKTLNPWAEDYKYYDENDGDFKPIFERLGPNILKELGEGFGNWVEINVPDPNDSTKMIKEMDYQFSILKTAWPVAYAFGTFYDLFINFWRGTYQKMIKDWVEGTQREATEAFQNTSQEIQMEGDTLLRRMGIPPLDSMQIETPEIDSTLLRQQEGPVEGSDDPTSPNYSYGMLINAWNNANTNDKISEYDQTNKKAIYKGKEGTISLNGNNEMIFISDDNTVRKKFDGYKAQ
jgi:hypothetical protein